MLKDEGAWRESPRRLEAQGETEVDLGGRRPGSVILCAQLGRECLKAGAQGSSHGWFVR